MNLIQKGLALLLAFVLVVSCFPLGATAAYAAENEDTEADVAIVSEDEPTSISTRASDGSGSSGSETGDGSDGSGNAPNAGSSNMIATGVTMQVVYYRYDQCYNRYNSHGNVINTLQTGKAVPWNSTGKDTGATDTTVFDTFTISPHTFLVKARWESYPYVYHFPNENLKDDGCTFSWSRFTNWWFDSSENTGGKASTYPRIVRNEAGGSMAIENYLARIILGNEYGAWDKLDVAKGETVATDTSLFASLLKYLGASDLAVQNYLDAYHGKLSITQNGSTLIPTIIWSWIGAENLGGKNRIYTIGDVAAVGSSNTSWLKTAYTSGANCNTGYGKCKWMKESDDTMICKMMLGGTHSTAHNATVWGNESLCLFGTGLVNRIQTQVDATEENGSNTFYYLRGYWTPYGSGNGSVSLKKTNEAGTQNLAGAEFTLYRDAACTTPVTSADYYSLNTSDAGYVSASVRRTNGSGNAKWSGLYTGNYFLKETKAPEGYHVNVDANGNVEISEINVGSGDTSITLTNAGSSGPISLKKSINASAECIAQIQGNPLYSLEGAEYSITLNGAVVETLKTDANGNATSTRQFNVGDVLTIRETKAPKGYKLDTKTYTHIVTEGDNVVSVSDVPVFDPPLVIIKVDKDTEAPQGDGSFKGAVFKWEFFTNNSWSGTPERVWYLATDANGMCIYDTGYLASGYSSSALYYSPAGVSQLPLGTLKITEVKSSLGYTTIPQVLYCTIAEDSSAATGAKHVWTEESAALMKQLMSGNWAVYEPIDTALFGSVSIEKYDAVTGQTPQGDATLKGAAFQIINSSANAVKVNGSIYQSGAVICTLITDENGYAATGNIFPVGTYTIKESAAPEGYLLNTQWQKTFSVTTASKDHSFSYADKTGCPDTVISGKIKIVKQISNQIDDISVPEPGAVFQVKNKNGQVVDTITTGEDGVGLSKVLPYGTYSVTQISGYPGTILCDDWTASILSDGSTIETNLENALWTASVNIIKKEAGAGIPLEATFELCERKADGTVKVLETGTTNAEGKLAFGRKIVYSDGLCNQSAYFIRETAAPTGYAIDPNEYPIYCNARDQKITITLENAPLIGSIEIRKSSSQGKPMMGVRFLLEYSLDGGTSWIPIGRREEDDPVITVGTATSMQLEPDGVLNTSVDGIASFVGLRVYTEEGAPILYRVIEVRTQDGASLMPGPVWEDDLIIEEDGEYYYTLVIRVVNSPILELPETGSHSLLFLPMAMMLCTAAGITALIALHRREKQEK